MLKINVSEFNELSIKNKEQQYQLCQSIFPKEILDVLFPENPSYILEKTFSPTTPVTHISPYILDKEVTEKIFDKAQFLFSLYHYYEAEKLFTLRKMIISLSFVHEALKPLTKLLNFKYEIGIVGGSIRDFLLDKQQYISDLDIVFAIKDIKGFSRHTGITLSELVLSAQEITDQLKIAPFVYKEEDKTDVIEQLLFHLINETIAKDFHIREAFAPRMLPQILEQPSKAEIWRSGYHNRLLRGVIKIDAPHLAFPVDLLICNESVKSYINSFDFEICKTWLFYTNDVELDSAKHIEKLENILIHLTTEKIEKAYQNIGVSVGFLKDVVNETLTLSPCGFDMDAIEGALLKHYPKVKRKFSKYKLICPTLEKITDREVQEYIDKYISYEDLNNKIPTKELSKEIKKIVRQKI